MATQRLQGLLDKIRVPLGGEKVYKDECAFSFDNPETDTGLYVCMKTFIGFGRQHVMRHFQKTGNPVYLHLKTTKTKKPEKEEASETKKPKPTRLAIGVEGGFDVEDTAEYDYHEDNSIVILPEWDEVPLANPDLPEKVLLVAAGILTAESASRQEQIAAWDGEKRVISKHATGLKQLDNGVKVPPSGWKCSMCELKDNLWMNLTDGTILCGRRYFDGTGGNNHALEHFKTTGFPIAVKLGTITASGGDVYSYDEDDMVEDPKLAEHLSHFGINMMIMEKTDKTMTELEIDLNSRLAEWDTILESGSKLQPLFGPGYTGMRNLGNSCYMNSVMQVIFSIQEFIDKYPKHVDPLFENASTDPTSDFNVQMAKLGQGLLSGEYSKQSTPEATAASGDEPQVEKGQEGIAPRMFKSLVGRGHPEFCTNRQQDAQEYLLHLVNIIERNSVGSSNPCDSFQFEVEERIQCVQSKAVRYKSKTDYILALPIPMEAATNKAEFEAYEAKKKELEASKQQVDPSKVVRPCISLDACIQAFVADEIVDDFYSTAINAKSTACKSTRLASFPDYLFIQLKKFTLGDDWVPKKLDVSVDMSDVLDLTSVRGKGLQGGEVELPEGDGPPAPEPQIDESVVDQLVGMGFAREGCRKAVFKTNNAGTEAAMNWVLEHMGDPDFAEPLQLGGKKKASEVTIDEESVVMIQSMGFTRDQAVKALKETAGSVERAADWIFSHMDELDSAPMETDQAAGPSAAAGPKCRDGSGKYELAAFISHMGTSTACGHYVCHVKKDGKWVIFNDRKVAVSEKTPKDLGYLYLYKRL